MKIINFITIILPFVTFAQVDGVGINVDNPTETLHVNGTVRITNLPTKDATSGIATQDDGTPSLNANGSLNKNQPFNAINTVVVDNNGVFGSVEDIALSVEPEISAIQYVTKTVDIDGNTPSTSVVSIGDISIRFNAINTSNSGDNNTFSFRLENNITDNVIVNQIRFDEGTSLSDIESGRNRYISAQPGPANWYIIDDLPPRIDNDEFIQYNISLLNSQEVYRLSAFVNDQINIDPGASPLPIVVASRPEVTIFLEYLTEIN